MLWAEGHPDSWFSIDGSNFTLLAMVSLPSSSDSDEADYYREIYGKGPPYSDVSFLSVLIINPCVGMNWEPEFAAPVNNSLRQKDVTCI